MENTLKAHAEAILRAAFPSMNFELTTIAARQPRVLEACANLRNAVLEEAASEAKAWFPANTASAYPAGGVVQAILSLRTKGPDHE